MSVKTYLQEQIRLVTMSGYDLFTDEEYDLYMEIVGIGKTLDKMYSENAPDEEKQPLLDQKSEKKKALETLICSHSGKPRSVRLKSVLYKSDDAKGATWKTLKTSKKIAEFSCELSRTMGLKPNEATLDLIVIKWKNLDELEQLVLDGFFFPLLLPDGSVEQRKYRLFSASAGQLRRDKILCISEPVWERIKDRIQAGLTWEWINDRGSLNLNKYMAYLALCNSATEEWPEIDIDQTIVIGEFESEVTDRMMYIKPDYTYSTGLQTVLIDQTDGCGMMLPEISTANTMVRGPAIKGLLVSFDFLRFCRVKNVPPVIKDVWGLEHDLVKENIKVIFTSSQVKLYKLFKSWEEFKIKFKENGCCFCKTNYEETFIPDTYLNYQMLQTLTDFTDEEIKKFTKKERERIENISRNKDTMLEALGAGKREDLSEPKTPYATALSLYPDLLRDAYSIESLKAIRKRMLLDAKSGKIRCLNKRLFAIPDMYAACEFWFCGVKNPVGLLKNGEVACRIFRYNGKADILRSPHLYMEHCVRTIVSDQSIYDWFYTNGIYMSCHDLISHVLQCDWDGDQLNVVAESLIVEIAERNVKEFDVIPLFYDANKAAAEPITNQALFHALKRAHDYSGIGEVSNMLTRLWNKENPDRIAAAFLTRYNNDVIDAAKTGKIIHYSQFPKVAKRIGKATGGKNGRMPFFFQFSKNGRKNTESNRNRKYADINNSTMSRICKAFDGIGRMNLNNAGVAPFNWQMLLETPCEDYDAEIAEDFCRLDSRTKSGMLGAQDQTYSSERRLMDGIAMAAEDISEYCVEKYGSLEKVYPHVVKRLFEGNGVKRSGHKQMFWKIFGDIALRVLKNNLDTGSVCAECGMRIPAWEKNHGCGEAVQGIYTCIECNRPFLRKNNRQQRCPECQDNYRHDLKNQYTKERRKKMKEEKEKRISHLRSSSEET